MLKSSLLIACVALALGGCASHSRPLAQDSSPELIKGEFIHSSPSSMILTTLDRRYVANGFDVRRHTNMAELQRRYKISEPKHWDRIFAGFDREHDTYSAEPKPKARDGAELSCRLAWVASKPPEGICHDKNGKPYQVRFN
jgi:hypothetical protein